MKIKNYFKIYEINSIIAKLNLIANPGLLIWQPNSIKIPINIYKICHQIQTDSIMVSIIIEIQLFNDLGNFKNNKNSENESSHDVEKINKNIRIK